MLGGKYPLYAAVWILPNPQTVEDFKPINIKDYGGKLVYLVDAKVWDKKNGIEDGKFGLLVDTLKEYAQRGEITKITQFYKLVEPGLILARHIFEGLCRSLHCDGNQSGDEDKLVYTRKPAWDFVWIGDRFRGKPGRRDVAPGTVFAVLVTPNSSHQQELSDIDGWINHWNWIEELKLPHEGAWLVAELLDEIVKKYYDQNCKKVVEEFKPRLQKESIQVQVELDEVA